MFGFNKTSKKRPPSDPPKPDTYRYWLAIKFEGTTLNIFKELPELTNDPYPEFVKWYQEGTTPTYTFGDSSRVTIVARDRINFIELSLPK